MLLEQRALAEPADQRLVQSDGRHRQELRLVAELGALTQRRAETEAILVNQRHVSVPRLGCQLQDHVPGCGEIIAERILGLVQLRAQCLQLVNSTDDVRGYVAFQLLDALLQPALGFTAGQPERSRRFAHANLEFVRHGSRENHSAVVVEVFEWRKHPGSQSR